MMRARIIGILMLTASSTALAGPVEWRLRHKLEEQATAREQRLSNRARPAPDEAIAALYFDQRIDHAAGDGSATYREQYFLDSSLALGPNSPVIFYLCGEWDCESSSISSGAIRNYARDLHAHLVALEHRFYGQSLPFPRFDTASLRYLSTTAALEDAAAFQRYAIEHHNLRGKWIAVGASYSANLSAYYRSQYPDLAVGALASSGPVRADADFSEYDQHVTKVAGPACADAMRRVTATIENALDHDPSTFDAIKAKFAAQGVRDAVDFLYLVADVGAAAVQYGMRDSFCEALQNAGEAGELGAYATFAQNVFAMWGEDAVGFSMQGSESEDPAESPMRPWIWQSCTEYGYWQNAAANPADSTRSPRINADYHNALCRHFFGEQMQPVDPSAHNARLYEPLLNAGHSSQIFFTNGSQDPWSTLSLTPAGQDSERNPSLELMLIDGAAHCDDLRAVRESDSTALKMARARFLELMHKWL